MSNTFAFTGRSDANGQGSVAFQIPYGQWWYIQNIWCSDTSHTAWQLRLSGFPIAQGQGVGSFTGVGLLEQGGKVNVDFASGTISGTVTIIIYAEIFTQDPEGRAPQDVSWVGSSLGSNASPPNPTAAFQTQATGDLADHTMIAAPAAGLQIYLYGYQIANDGAGATTGLLQLYAGTSSFATNRLVTTSHIAANNEFYFDFQGLGVFPDANGNPQALIYHQTVAGDSFRLSICYTVDAAQQGNPFIGGSGGG